MGPPLWRRELDPRGAQRLATDAGLMAGLNECAFNPLCVCGCGSSAPTRVCHRCCAPRADFFSSAVYRTKTAATRRVQITAAAAGDGLQKRGMVAGGSVVDWGEAPSHAPGPNSANYEAFRELCGAHLVYNAFWNVKHFCVHQMLMRDPMHQVDLGAIVHLIKAILRKYAECVETALGIACLLYTSDAADE